MKIIVTGAKGQLGSDLLPVLVDHEVVAVDVDTVDVTDRDSVFALIREVRPDRLINCAAMTAVDACETDEATAFAVNADAVQYLAAGCEEVGAHLVTISTDYVFDGSKDRPYVEDDPPAPASVYGRSKLAGELAAGRKATIVRTAWLSGFHGQNMVKTIVRLLEGDGRLRFVDDQIGCPTFTSDLAPVVARLALDELPGVFHVTNQGAVSWFEFAREVALAVGADPSRIDPCATADLQPPRPAPRPANSVLENAAIRGAGYPALRHFREPLNELIEEMGRRDAD